KPPDRDRGRGERGKQRGDRARQRRDDSERNGPTGAAARQEQRTGNRRQQAEGEREPTGEQVGRGAGAEPQRADPRVLAELVTGEDLEQRRTAARRQAGRDLRRERRCDRREQHAVAGNVVAAVPPVVPDPEALARKQLRAQQMRGKIQARWRDQHVRNCERSRDERGRDAPRVYAAVSAENRQTTAAGGAVE